jgi:hypothetical protein
MGRNMPVPVINDSVLAGIRKFLEALTITVTVHKRGRLA